MSQALSKAFYDKVTYASGGGTYSGALTGRIYAAQAPENATLPLGLIRVIGSDVSPFFGGTTRQVLRVTVDTIYDKSAGQSAVQTTDGLLFSQVHGTTVAGVTGFDRATIVCESRGVPEALEDAMVVSSTYTITGYTT